MEYSDVRLESLPEFHSPKSIFSEVRNETYAEDLFVLCVALPLTVQADCLSGDEVDKTAM